MLSIEHEVANLSYSQYIAAFGLSHGYLQLELDLSTRNFQSFITPAGVLFSLARVLHGTKNSVKNLQSALAEVIAPTIRNKLLARLDDILLYYKIIPGIIGTVQEMLRLCSAYGIRWHLCKIHP